MYGSRLKILLDVDEVLRPIMSEVIKIYNKEHKTNIKFEDIKKWGLSNTFPLIDDDEHFFKFHSEQIFSQPDPYPFSPDIVYDLYRNHEVVIVSSQFDGLEDLTLDWLKKHDFKFHNIFFEKDKSLIKGDVMIDDGVHNLINSSCKYNICVDRPWNKDFEGIRARSLVSAYNYLVSIETNEFLKNGY